MKKMILLSLISLFATGAFAQNSDLDEEFGQVVSIEKKSLDAQRNAFCEFAAPKATAAYGQVVFSVPDCKAAKTEIRKKGNAYFILNYTKSYYGDRDLTVVAGMKKQGNLTEYTSILILGLGGE